MTQSPDADYITESIHNLTPSQRKGYLGITKYFQDSGMVLAAQVLARALEYVDDTRTQPIENPSPIVSIPDQALLGVCGRNSEHWRDVDYQAVKRMNLAAIKMMSETDPSVYRRIRQYQPDMKFICRLRDDRINKVGHGVDPAAFVARCEPVINQLLFGRDTYGKVLCVDYQVHNEPNHQAGYEGWSPDLAQADDFNRWYLEVLSLFRKRFPQARFGFPGLATPHGQPPDYELAWLKRCREAVLRSDWAGVHCYWQHSHHFDSLFGLRYRDYHALFPNTPFHILECGDSTQQSGVHLNQQKRANEFHAWLKHVRSESKQHNIVSIHPFILSSPYVQWENEGFVMAEDSEKILPIVDAIAAVARQED